MTRWLCGTAAPAALMLVLAVGARARAGGWVFRDLGKCFSIVAVQGHAIRRRIAVVNAGHEQVLERRVALPTHINRHNDVRSQRNTWEGDRIRGYGWVVRVENGDEVGIGRSNGQ